LAILSFLAGDCVSGVDFLGIAGTGFGWLTFEEEFFLTLGADADF